jgi:hypothetical protein
MQDQTTVSGNIRNPMKPVGHLPRRRVRVLVDLKDLKDFVVSYYPSIVVFLHLCKGTAVPRKISPNSDEERFPVLT